MPPFIPCDYFCDSGNALGSTATNGMFVDNPQFVWGLTVCRGDPFILSHYYAVFHTEVGVGHPGISPPSCSFSSPVYIFWKLI